MTVASVAKWTESRLSIKVTGTQLDATLADNLLEARVDRSYRLPTRCTLRFRDPTYQISSQGKFALAAPILVMTADGETTLFTGEVTGFEVDQVPGDHPTFIVTAHDKSYRLGLSSSGQVFNQMSIPDLVTKVAGNVGLSADVDPSADTYVQLVQGDTDLVLLNALADRAACDWWVDPSTGALQFKKPAESPSATELKLGSDLASFSVRASANGLPSSVTTTAWDPSAKQTVPGTASPSDTTMTADAEILGAGGFASTVASAFGTNTQHVAGPMVATGAEADTWAKSIATDLTWSAVTASGTAYGALDLSPGTVISVTDAGPTSGHYYISRSEVRFSTKGLHTTFVAGSHRPRTLADLLAPAPGSFFHHGVLVGVVSNNNSDAHPGCVTVSIPTLGEDFVTDWARVVSVGGGENRGIVFHPEINDEVLVAFDSGDPRRPIVIGGLHNGVDTWPDQTIEGGGVATRTLTSRLGHTIQMGDGDSPSDQFIALTLTDGETFLKLAADNTVTLQAPDAATLTISVGSNTSITMDAQSVSIKAMQVQIQATTSLSLSAADATMSADASMSISADGPLSASGATASISADSALELSGATVMIG